MSVATPSFFKPHSTAAIMAAVLLTALAWTGWSTIQQMRLAPSSVPPATVSSAQAAHSDPASRQRATSLASGPRWAELSRTQRKVLDPLEDRWPMMGAVQKRRWMVLADGYDKLSEREQEKFHSRMSDWSNLSAQQRNQARLNFALTNKLATDKQAQWEAYQALSEEERRLLAARATPKVVTAAPAIKPAPPKRLARIPAATATPNTVANPPKIPPTTVLHPPPMVPVLPTAVETRPVRPAAVVETTPVDMPSAAPVTLPPLDAPPLAHEAPGVPSSSAYTGN